ncbi:MAG: DNA polymerase IV [Paracoccaceae bacterium]
MDALCRDCCAVVPGPGRCPGCGSPRVLAHPELFALAIAHMDCDAFYASVEKRDDPALRDKPVIIGGGRRGVVSTACYIARTRGVKSAMPMFQALKRCPEAVVVKPRMSVYAGISRQIRGLMKELTPLVEPLSLDEAFLDLTGTRRLHGEPPAAVMARLVKRIEAEIGVTASVGLSHNKFLAKIASDLDKPRGFSVIGRAETAGFLESRPVSVIWGVGNRTRAALERDGIRTIADLRTRPRKVLAERYGAMGERLWHLARGADRRRVSPSAPMKSLSRETTFPEDLSDSDLLEGHLWRLSEQVSDRAKSRGLAGRVVTLKLKQSDHRQLSRRASLAEPTQSADRIFRTALPLLSRELPRGPFRLLGVGISRISADERADTIPDLLDPSDRKRLLAERATDTIRAKFGADSIVRGRSLR